MANCGVTALGHVLVCWALVFEIGMGSKGAVLNSAISYFVNLTMLMLALYGRLFSVYERTWTGFSMEAFRDLLRFTKLSIPSTMMVW